MKFRLYRRRIVLGIVVLLGVVNLGLAQENPVKTEVDTTTIRIGEQILFKISVNGTDPVVFPHVVPDTLGKVELVESLPVDTLKNSFEKKYLLTSFDSGSYVIKRQLVLVNNLKYYTDSIRINVIPIKVDTTKQKMFPIKAIKSEPKTFDDYKHLLWWLIPILLLIGLILYFIFRKKAPESVALVSIPPIQEALQRLKELDEKQLLKQNKIKIYYTELTDIVRTYIEKDTHIPALESTTNELIETITDFNESSNLGISKETITELRQVLQGADLVKFAKSKPILEEIRTDRGIIEKIILNTQSAVQDKRLQEEQARGEFTVSDGIEKSYKKSYLKRNILIIGAVIIIVVGALSYLGYRYIQREVLGNSIEQMEKKQWYTSSYGTPSVSLESPEILQPEPVDIPEELMGVVKDMSNFSFGSMRGNFYMAVVTTNFVNKIEDYDYDNGIVGSLRLMESQIGTTFSEVQQDLRINNGVEGRIVLARYDQKNTDTQVITNNVLTMLLFVDDQSMRQVVITQSATDSVALGIRDRILKSVSLNQQP